MYITDSSSWSLSETRAKNSPQTLTHTNTHKIHTNTYTRTCTRKRARTRPRAHAHAHTHTCTYIEIENIYIYHYINMYVCMYVCVYFKHLTTLSPLITTFAPNRSEMQLLRPRPAAKSKQTSWRWAEGRTGHAKPCQSQWKITKNTHWVLFWMIFSAINLYIFDVFFLAVPAMVE